MLSLSKIRCFIVYRNFRSIFNKWRKQNKKVVDIGFIKSSITKLNNTSKLNFIHLFNINLFNLLNLIFYLSHVNKVNTVLISAYIIIKKIRINIKFW